MEKDRGLKYSFFEDLKRNNGYKAAGKIKVPTLIVHGDLGSIVPLDQSVKTSRLIKDCRLEIIDGCDHFYSRKKDLRKAISLTTRFFTEKSKKL